jgi:sec-independent protein translocase protein TatA
LEPSVEADAEIKMDLFAPSHLLILLVIVLLIFGPSKLGDVGGALGKAIRDFKHAMNEPDLTSAPPKAVASAPEPPASEPKTDKPA